MARKREKVPEDETFGGTNLALRGAKVVRAITFKTSFNLMERGRLSTRFGSVSGAAEKPFPWYNLIVAKLT